MYFSLVMGRVALVFFLQIISVVEICVLCRFLNKKLRAVFPLSLLDTKLDDIFYIGQSKKGQKSGVNEGEFA